MKKLIAGGLIAMTAATAAFAMANDAITARQAAMKAVGAAAKAQDFAAMHQAALAAQAAFMEDTSGSGTIPTEAADAIWTDKASFDAIMGDLVTKAAAGDRAVFDSCKACHKDYRIKN